MPALTADVHRMHSVHQPQFLPLPVKGGARIYLNAITCTDANGFAVPGANTAGLRAQGVAWKPFDNTAGADGTLGDTFSAYGAVRFVEVDSQGEWEPAPKAVEVALASAYKKDNLAQSNVVVKINAEDGTMKVYTQKDVVDEVEDDKIQMTVEEARRFKPDANVGDVLNFEATPANAGRIAAQTAKQVVLQRLREAEREVVYEEYSGKEGDIVSGTVQRMEGRNVIVDLGKTEAVLPPPEQVRTEHVQNRTVVDWGLGVAERLDRWGEELRGFRVGETEARFRAVVARNPGKSLLAACAAGVLLGLWLRRR